MTSTCVSTPTWAEERQRWREDWPHRLEHQLSQTTAHVRRHISCEQEYLAAHCDSLLTLLQRTRSYPHLHTQTSELIIILGPWPQRWGHWNTWEELLRFAIHITDAQQKSNDQAAHRANLAHLLFHTGRLEQALAVGQNALEQAIIGNVPYVLARAASLLITILQCQGNAQAAGNLLEQTETWLTQCMDAGSALAYLYCSRATLLRRQGHLDEAVTWADRAVALAKRCPADDPYLLAEAYNTRGIMHWAWGKYITAAADLNQAAKLYTGTGDHYAKAAIRGNLGLVYWSIGDLDQAEVSIRHAIAISERQGARWRLAPDVGNLGLVYLSRGEMERALAYVEEHLHLATQNQDVHEKMRARVNLGIVRLNQKNFDAALPDLETAGSFARERGGRESRICIYVNLARCLANLGREDEALALARDAFSLAQETHAPALKVISLRGLAERLPRDQQAPYLQEALQLTRQSERQLDEAACLLSLAALEDGKEQTVLWNQGTRLLKKINATAWLSNCVPQTPPQIVLFL